jgi:hypothetical protein
VDTWRDEAKTHFVVEELRFYCTLLVAKEKGRLEKAALCLLLKADRLLL